MAYIDFCVVQSSMHLFGILVHVGCPGDPRFFSHAPSAPDNLMAESGHRFMPAGTTSKYRRSQSRIILARADRF